MVRESQRGPMPPQESTGNICHSAFNSVNATDADGALLPSPSAFAS